MVSAIAILKLYIVTFEVASKVHKFIISKASPSSVIFIKLKLFVFQTSDIHYKIMRFKDYLATTILDFWNRTLLMKIYGLN